MERPRTAASHGAVCVGGVACTSHGAVCVGQHFLAWHIYRGFQIDFSVMSGLL